MQQACNSPSTQAVATQAVAPPTAVQNPTSQQHPFRIRTITAFLQLPPDARQWEAEVEAAGRLLKFAQQHLEGLGYEVQTLRIATQPFPEFLAAQPHTTVINSSHTSSSSSGGGGSDGCPSSAASAPYSDAHVMVTNAVLLEQLAARHGVPLVSIGSSSDPRHLQVIPRIIAATSSTSCSFHLPAGDSGWDVAHAVAEAVMEVARQTGGMGNFRFACASNMQPGIPFFPVAFCGPQQHRSFALGTEPDALLHMAFAAAAADVAAAAAVPAAAAGPGSSQPQSVVAAARRHLHKILLEHWAPLEAAAKQIQQLFNSTQILQEVVPQGSAAAGAADNTPAGSNAAAAAVNGTTSSAAGPSAAAACAAGGTTALLTPPGGFTYLGLDTSLAPGLDTPALTASYELLLQSLQAGCGHKGSNSNGVTHIGSLRLDEPPSSNNSAAAAQAQPAQAPSSQAAPAEPAVKFGAPGTLTLSSMVTQVLKELPLELTGYCGLMLAVCEDEGLAAAAAAGSITISQLLQYSAVCGCGLDTVPVPGPTQGQKVSQQQQQETPRHEGQQAAATAAAAAAVDADTTAAIAGLIADVNTLAYRLNKPLACRLLPLPGKHAGQPTGFDHPYMVNSRVMDLHK